MDMSINIHIPAFLPPGKGPQLSTEWESGEGVRGVLDTFKKISFIIVTA